MRIYFHCLTWRSTARGYEVSPDHIEQVLAGLRRYDRELRAVDFLSLKDAPWTS